MAEAQKSAAKPSADGGGEASGQPRILRVGILQGGRIVEERLVRKRGDVTIGQSAKNTFVVPASSAVPRSFTLFEVAGSAYVLNFTDGMDGRIASEQNVAPQTLVNLKAKAQKKGTVYRLMLPEKSRGKVVIGDLTVLFQFVNPPPVQARPQLPPSVRGSLTQNLDWMMIGIVALSIFGHFGFVIYLRQVDWPRRPDIEEIPDRFVKMIVQKKEEKKTEEKVDPNANKKSDDSKKAVKKDKPKPRDAEAEARAAAERRTRLSEQVPRARAARWPTSSRVAIPAATRIAYSHRSAASEWRPPPMVSATPRAPAAQAPHVALKVCAPAVLATSRRAIAARSA